MRVGCNPAVKTVVKRNFVISKLGRLLYRVTIKVIIYGSLITPMIQRSFTAWEQRIIIANNKRNRWELMSFSHAIQSHSISWPLFRSKCRPGHFRKSLFHTSRWPMAKWVCVCQTTEICSKKCLEFYWITGTLDVYSSSAVKKLCGEDVFKTLSQVCF